MPASPTEVTRTDDATGDTFATYDNDAGRKVQSMALDPEIQGELLSHYATGNAAESTAEPKGTPGRVFEVGAVLDPTTATDRYLMVFDKAGTPVNTDIPVLRALVPAGGQVSIDLGIYGREFAAGIAIALSTTVDALTLPATAEGFFQVRYL